FLVNATVEAIAEYDRLSNIREDIIRHIIVKE
ncbi:MAG: 30S ribosomal protein S6, partial [Bacilli bacterium]